MISTAVKVSRLKADGLGTIGFMSINGVPAYFTLEDAHHEIKIAGKTRIPSGVYALELRNEGSITKKYLEKYGADFHKGMLWLRGVPNFEYIYIHTGNTVDHTEGCLLVGTTADLTKGRKVVGKSVDAYKDVYAILSRAILEGQAVTIEIVDEY